MPIRASGRCLPVSARSRQRGAALLVLATVLVLAGSSLLLSRFNPMQLAVDRARVTAEALATAKVALIAHAADSPGDHPGFGPGRLPCPDTSPDESAAGFGWPGSAWGGFGSAVPEGDVCAGIGRLPWRILGLGDPRDGDNERLWYAVSPGFTDPDGTRVINSETQGQLSLDGRAGLVALVIAPGVALGDQADGRPGIAVADYLEAQNAVADTVAFVSGPRPDPATGEVVLNDRIVAIEHPELFAPVERRVAGEIARALRQYAERHGSYPWLSPFANPRRPALIFGGIATGGSATTLVDSTQDFGAVPVGAWVNNRTDGSRGQVQGGAGDTVTVGSFTGGLANQATAGHRYDVSLVFGTTDCPIAGQTPPCAGSATRVRDDDADFVAAGVELGDLVRNLPDGSMAAVVLVDPDNPDSLTLSPLDGGVANLFAPGDGYEIQRFRFNSVQGVDRGSPGFHFSGQVYATPFEVLELTVTGAASPTSGTMTPIGNEAPSYLTSITGFLSELEDIALPIGVRAGSCTWSRLDEVECWGSSPRVPFFEGVAGDGSTGTTLFDPERQFGLWVSPGDRMEWWALRIAGTMGAGSGGNTLLDTTEDFVVRGVQTGDRVVARLVVEAGEEPPDPMPEDLTYAGRVAGVAANELSVDLEAGGARAAFESGDTYEIYPAAPEPVPVPVATVAADFLTVTDLADFRPGQPYRLRIAAERRVGQIPGGLPGVVAGENWFTWGGAADGIRALDSVRRTADPVTLWKVVESVDTVNGRVTVFPSPGPSVTYEPGQGFEVRRRFIATREYFFDLTHDAAAPPLVDGGESRSRTVLGGMMPPRLSSPVRIQDYDDAGVGLRWARWNMPADPATATINAGTGGVRWDLLPSLSGVAGLGSVDNLLDDWRQDFRGFAVRPWVGAGPGESIENLTTGATGTVQALGAADGAGRIRSLTALGVTFSPGDAYRIPAGADPDPLRRDALPAWVVANGWHRLAYVAISPSLVPGGDGACVGGVAAITDGCLVVEVADDGGGTVSARFAELVVMLAGRPLDAQQEVARQSAVDWPDAYFENQVLRTDSTGPIRIWRRGPAFNDTLFLVEPRAP